MSAPPVSLSTFVGRQAELALGAQLLQRSRLVTITGPGGAGKTRLSVELAGSTAMAFADLSPALDAESAQAALAGALGVEPAPGGAGRERIVRHLGGQAGLLIVDNCEQVIDAAAELVESILVAAPEVKVLATSQEALALPGEMLLRLGALAEGDAELLFTERLRQGDPRHEPDAGARPIVAEVCRRLDGIPLAVELAAARARTMPLPDLLAALEDRFALLVGASRRAPTRQQTLEAAVAWSYDLLSAEEREVFDRVSVLPGSFTAAAAQAVAAGVAGERQLPLLLSRLGERSLLDLAGDRYRMAETLRAFGRDRLRQSGRLGDALLAGARHYDAAGAFRTALGLSLAAREVLPPGDPRRDELLDLAAGEAERVGRYDVGADVLAELRSSAGATARPERLANIEMRLASALSMATGDLARAQPPAEHALALYQGLGDVPMALQAEVEVAWLDGMGGDVARQGRRALDVVERAAQQAPRSDAHLHALGCAAVPIIFMGQLEQGRRLLDAGLEIAESKADAYQIGWFTGFLAHAVTWTDGPTAALRLLAEVRPRVEEHLDPVFLEGEAHARLLAGRPAPLLEEARAADDLVVGFGLRGGFVMSARAVAAAETGQAALAEQLLASAHRLFAGTDIYYQRRAHVWLEGVARWCGGDPATGARTILRGVDELLERRCATLAALALRDAADAAWDAGDHDLEAAVLARLGEVADRLEGRVFPALLALGEPGTAEELGKLGCLGLRARSLEREGRLEEAAVAYEELGLRYRADRALTRLAAQGREPSPAARGLARLALFEGIPVAQLELLAAATVRQTFEPGERLHRQDAPAEAVFAVESGAVLVGQSQAGAGDLVGERSLLPGERHVTNATATEAVAALRLPPAAVYDLVRQQPRLAERLVTLVRQRLRGEARASGLPEPPDVAARVLGEVQQVAAAAGEPPPAYEILPVYLGDAGPWLLTPDVEGSWLVDAPPGRLPADVVAAALESAGCAAHIVHSTSWRFDQGRLVLTYLAIMPAPQPVSGFRATPVRRADLARGSAKGAPTAIALDQVVEHGLRHLSWLSRDDLVIKEELSAAWLETVAGYQPEPFRAL